MGESRDRLRGWITPFDPGGGFSRRSLDSLNTSNDVFKKTKNYSIPAEVAPVKMLAMLETLEIIHSIPASFTPSFCIPTLRNLKLATLRPTDLLNPDDGWELRFEPEEIEQLKACSERWGVTFSAQMRKQKAERLFRKAFGS